MNQKYKQRFLKAGALAGEVRRFGKDLVCKGASYQEVLRLVNQKIFELGAIPAFPPQIALNQVAAHFLLEPGQDHCFTDEVVKLDVGVCFEGAIGDCAVTIDLSGKYQKLVDAAEAALLQAEKSIRVGQPLREIGKIIDETITGYGFKPIKNLSGHGLGPFQIHTSPHIPNYDDSSKGVVKPGMTFAIEPFATDGKGLIYESGDAAIYSFRGIKPFRSDMARKILPKIRTFNNLPFSLHDLMDQGLGLSDIKIALSELIKAKVIAGYPPLLEAASGIVAQAENSVLVDEKGLVFITTR